MALMRFTGGLDRRRGQRKEDCMRGLAAMAIRERWSDGCPRPATLDWTREAPVSPSINKVHSTGGGRMRPPLREHDYRLAGTFPASAAEGIVVTRPCVPVACA